MPKAPFTDEVREGAIDPVHDPLAVSLRLDERAFLHGADDLDSERARRNPSTRRGAGNP